MFDTQTFWFIFIHRALCIYYKNGNDNPFLLKANFNEISVGHSGFLAIKLYL